jgi:hypothetical protein
MTRFQVSTAPLVDARRRVAAVYVDCDGARATWGEVLDGLEHDAGLRGQLTTALAEAPFAAYFWETCPVAADRRECLFECVIVESQQLARISADPSPFSQHFVRPDGPSIRVFANLGRDALMVVPFPPPNPSHCGHLAAFLRHGSASQVDQLWATLGRTIRGRLSRDPGPLWVSTSGLGVSWLHVRLERRPKYLTWVPFRVPTGR